MRLTFRKLVLGFLLFTFLLLTYVIITRVEELDEEGEDSNYFDDSALVNFYDSLGTLDQNVDSLLRRENAAQSEEILDLKQKLEELEKRVDSGHTSTAAETLIEELRSQVETLKTQLEKIDPQSTIVEAPISIETTVAPPEIPVDTETQSQSQTQGHFHDQTPEGSYCGEEEIYSPICRSCMKIKKFYDKKINFVHVPRSGGSSFSVAVRSYLDCEPLGKGCWGEPSITVGGNVDCGGRIASCYGLTPLRAQNSVIMIREPVSRLRSSFADKQFPGGTSDQKAAAKAARNIQEYIQLPGISNCLTKILNEKPCGDLQEMTSDELKVAKMRIESVDYFGIMEHYNTSVCLMYKKFGGVPRETDFIVTKKLTTYNPSVPLPFDELELAKQSENYDIEVYQFAKTIFDKQLEEHHQPYVD